MSRLKVFLEMQPNIRKFRQWSKLFQRIMFRTDHIVCETLKNNTVHSVFIKPIPIHIGHWFTFNKEMYTPQQAKRKATTYLKNENIKRKWKSYANSTKK